MHPLQRAKSRLQNATLTVVFPEGEDERIQRAAARLAEVMPTLRPVLLGDAPAIRSRSEANGLTIGAISIVDPASSDLIEPLAELYRRNRPDTSIAVARRFARKPMYCAGLMLRQGTAHTMIAGVTCPTARVIEAAMLTVGLDDGVDSPSSFFIMQGPQQDRALVFADCAVNIEPDENALAAIGIASARSCADLLGVSPRVAFLSFSTHGSARHRLAEKMRDAAALARKQCPQYAFDGELQADAALVPAIARLKIRHEGDVAGQANVLVFPDLNAANIAYKLMQHLGGATALGPFLQGFAAPVSDLSRGASVQDIVDTTILTASRAAAG